MDEALLRQLTRQLKLLNFWITFFGVLFLIGFIVLGILIYKVVSFTHSAETKITNLQQTTSQTLDVQKQLCDTKSLGSFLQKETSACK